MIEVGAVCFLRGAIPRVSMYMCIQYPMLTYYGLRRSLWTDPYESYQLLGYVKEMKADRMKFDSKHETMIGKVETRKRCIKQTHDFPSPCRRAFVKSHCAVSPDKSHIAVPRSCDCFAYAAFACSDCGSSYVMT